MKRIILILLVAFAMGSCIKEDTYCPESAEYNHTMYLRFLMVDPYMAGDFDSRVGNDVSLYIFKDNILTHKETIPYDAISGGKEYAIDKIENADEVVGNDIKIVAWAVRELGDAEVHHPDEHPEYAIGCRFDAQGLTQSITYADTDMYATHEHERYIGTDLYIKEVSDQDSHHAIVMHPAPGRIVVNVNDPGGILDFSSGQPHVVVGGTMSGMNLRKEGIGNPVTVGNGISSTRTRTRAGDNTHSTGIFGVLPSQSGGTLSVDIMNGDTKLQTLSVRSDDNLHTVIESGELLEFDYTLGSSSFTITIGTWTRRIVIDENGGI